MSNNFDGPILFDTEDTGTMVNFLGFGRAAGTDVPLGPQIGVCNVDPSAGGGIAANLGSLLLRYDAGNIQSWQKTGAAATQWTQLSALSGSVSLTGVSSTATNGMQWTMFDNSAAATQFGAAGALNMLVFDTSNGAEQLIVNAANGLQLATNSELRFGTGGTQVIMNPDGTDVQVTGTGVIQYANNLISRYGTTAATAGEVVFTTAPNILQVRTRDTTTTTTASSRVLIATGATTEPNAAAGGASGLITIATGATDVTNAGGSGGASGDINIGTGNASSTAGAAGGATGNVLIQTGNSVDGVSGTITFTVGTAGTTRGVIDINAATLDYATQGVTNLVRDNTAVAFLYREGASNNMVLLDTTDDNETLDLGAVPATGVAQMGIRHRSPGGQIEFNGIDHGSRFVLTEDFAHIVQTTGSVANANANKQFSTVGTNAVDGSTTIATGGGNQLATAGAGNDQNCVRPHATAGQSAWTGTTWSTSDQIIFKSNFRIVDTANVRVATGIKQTLAAGATLFDNTTDNEQCWVTLSTDGSFGGTAANFVVNESAGGADVSTNTTVVANGGAANWRVVIAVDAGRIARVYINGILRRTTAVAFTAATALLGFCGIQALGAAVRTMNVQRLSMSKVLTG